MGKDTAKVLRRHNNSIRMSSCAGMVLSSCDSLSKQSHPRRGRVQVYNDGCGLVRASHSTDFSAEEQCARFS